MVGSTPDIGAALDALEVSNVFIYVGDAVRCDFLPTEFENRGAVVRTIASSTHSPASFASICTGRYPPAHGVHSFEDQLAVGHPRLLETPGVETRFLNSIFANAQRAHGQAVDPIYSVLDVEPAAVDSPFEGLEPPFIAMERGPGGHAPYGDFSGTAPDYFDSRGTDRETVRSDYARSVRLDFEHFEKRRAELADRGNLADTLVVYTSDHGELLGEGGLVGHNGPMRPELVYVPTVFDHPALPSTRIEDSSVHHVDLLPTVRSVLGVDTEPCDGADISSGCPTGPRPCFWENQFLPDRLPGVSGSLVYEGVWDGSGGRVNAVTPRHERLTILGAKLLRSSKRRYLRNHLRACLGQYWWTTNTFGDPGFDAAEGADVLERARANATRAHRGELSTAQREHLQDLGYVN